VDYLRLGSEELGSIYESLLELVPKWGGDRQFLFRETDEEEQKKAGGNERKKTGSYYTPTSLIDCLLDSSLDPVLDDATKRAEVAATAAGTDTSEAIAKAFLSVTVCDPACGSGHFLVAAARRIAKRVASVREHNPEPSLDAMRHAMRDVVANCVYGVDLNPMAVELAKVSLWMEGMEAGKPLSEADRRRHPGGRVQAHRGRRPEVRQVPGACQQRGSDDYRRAAARCPVLDISPRLVRPRPRTRRALRRRRHHLPIKRGPRGWPGQDRRDARRLAARGP
jgi:hypothetical protein